MLNDLQGRIYYNPLEGNYETSDRLISGNVIAKAEAIEDWIKKRPQTDNMDAISVSLKALQEAKPLPIPFDALDFNFGERWIPPKIYSEYAGYLFGVDAARIRKA